MDQSRWFFYDDVPTGHHPGYIRGVVAEAARQGLNPIVACSMPPPEGSEWLATTHRGHRAIIRNRAQLRQKSREAAQRGAAVFVDLYFDRNVWAGHAGRGLPRRIRVLHHASQYLPRSGSAAVRTRLLRRRLTSLTRSGDTLVVHTAASMAAITDFLDPTHVVKLGYPVGLPAPQRESGPASGPIDVLFVGGARHAKGLDLLIEAFTRVARRDARLTIIGRQPAGVRSELEPPGGLTDIRWIDEYVDARRLDEAYREASLAVLPYRTSFGRGGGPSSVLLETLGYGIPVLTTTALADQLPEGYEGSVVVEADCLSDLQRGLEQAMNNLAQLSHAARQVGPAFVSSDHSYDSYVKGLRSIAGPC